MFTLAGVSVVRGGSTLLHEVSADLAAGTLTVLTGASGAGKTTLLRLLNRLNEPTSGLLTLHGKPLTTWDVLELRRHATLVPQRPTLLTEEVGSELRIGKADLDEAMAAELLRRVGLASDMLSRSTGSLSGGEAQRLCLARSLALGPEVLLLDEPTSNLDTASATAIHELVRAHCDEGKTAVAVSHDTGWIASAADTVLVLRDGQLVEHGPPGQVAYLERAA